MGRINKIFLLGHLFSFLILIVMFLSVPFITHYLFGGLHYLFAGFGTILILFYASRLTLDQNIINWIFLWLIFLISYFALGVYHTVKYDVGFYELRKSFGLFFKILFVIGAAIIIRYNYFQFTKLLFKIHSVLILVGILSTLIIIVGSIEEDLIVFTKLDGRNHYFWLVGGSNSFFQFGDIKLFRLSCMADEPGALALIITWLLIINEFTFESKKIRILLTIGGVLTLSLAFFISLFFLIIYWLFIFKIKFKYVLSFFTIITPLLLFISLTKNPYISKPRDHLINRFSLVENGNQIQLKGDNRNLLGGFKNETLKENVILGIGKKNAFELGAKNDISLASAAGYMLMNGVYGYIFFYLPFLYLFWHFRNDKRIFLLFIIGLNFLQRPNIESMDAMIYLTLIYFSKYNSDLTYE